MIERGTLRDYQIEDLAFHMINPRSANLSDPGTGKTPTACAWMSWLWTDHGIRTVWPQPKTLMKKNRLELLKFSEFSEADVVIVDGNPKQRMKQMQSGAKVFLMGFRRFADDWRSMLQLYPDIKAVCIDEWQLGFANNDSNQTQQLYGFMRHADWFLPLTGTVIKGRLSSAYPMIRIINPNYYAGYQSFMNQHAMRDWFGTIIGWQGHDRIKQILDYHTRRHSFEEVYGKEAKVILPEVVEMSAKQREVYNEFEEKAMLELDDAFLTTGNAAVHVVRCRQIMGHPERIPHPSGLGTVDLMNGETTGKDERLILHVEEHIKNKEPLAVFACFQPEQERLHKLMNKLGMKTALINGTVSSAKRAELSAEFEAGCLDAIVASSLTAGVGLNWGHLNHMIFASKDYMDDSFIQAYRRAMRGVREKFLWITDLQYENSIDQRITQIVERKSEDAHKVDPTYQKLEFKEPVEESTANDNKPIEVAAKPLRKDGRVAGQKFGLGMI